MFHAHNLSLINASIVILSAFSMGEERSSINGKTCLFRSSAGLPVWAHNVAKPRPDQLRQATLKCSIHVVAFLPGSDDDGCYLYCYQLLFI